MFNLLLSTIYDLMSFQLLNSWDIKKKTFRYVIYFRFSFISTLHESTVTSPALANMEKKL